MESELSNAVNYIKNISKGKVIFAKVEASMRGEKLFTCKEGLDNFVDSFIKNGLMKKMKERMQEMKKCSFPNCQQNQQFSNISIILKKTTQNRMKRKTVLHQKPLKMTKVMLQ